MRPAGNAIVACQSAYLWRRCSRRTNALALRSPSHGARSMSPPRKGGSARTAKGTACGYPARSRARASR